MQISVAQLPEHLAARQEGRITAPLANFTVNEDASMLTVTNGEQRSFPLDEGANKALATYLKVPQAYFNKLTPDFRATLLKYEFARKEEAQTVVESLNNEIIAVHSPAQTMIPLAGVADVVGKVMRPEDTIRRLIINDTRLHIDVTTTEKSVVFTSASEVGDITEGGVRFLAYPFSVRKPSVESY